MTQRRSLLHAQASGFLCALGVAVLTLGSGIASAQTIAQSPLSVGGDVPGNLLLVPSVEWPTLDSMANLGAYDVTRKYVGYFDPDKCYLYKYSSVEADRHFYPTRNASAHKCSHSNKEWSGNYMNWAATQTIDPFRKALTGGYRVVDTTTETWLEKARSDANTGTSIYPDRRLPSSGNNQTLVRNATPASWDNVTIRIRQLGNKMRFTRSGDLNDDRAVVAYNPATHSTPNANHVYEVSVRVKVCDAARGVEANCKRYSGGWKPEGLIQKYSERIRFSVFGYLNDSDMRRDGGVLRAKQKFVGEYKVDPTTGANIANANREWDPTTGVFVRNPDSADAAATTNAVGSTIRDSGVINYINKFGQMTTQNHKSHDPVSELYYTAIRYLKNQGNVPEYSNLSGGGNATTRYNWADGFPVITQWDDPIQYWCQNNAILGIGDVNTHRDKNLPGNNVTTDEPAMPSAVSSDTTINVRTATNKVAQLEGITINVPYTGRENSAYIAGLAYDAHTKDLRPSLQEKQTVSTHWVDVREAQVLEGRARNQYWLAAKYGGFTVPRDFEPYTRAQALPEAWWSSGERLATNDLRPENFYVASEADKMVESLTRAFAKISAESAGSAASLAANSTRLETDTKTFQAQFHTGSWRGELMAYSVENDGALATSPLWLASAQLAAATWSDRKIYSHNPTGGTKYVTFRWDNLNSTQRTQLGNANVVDYLRGDRSKEESQANGTLRTRTNILGDIVNSTPVFVGKPNPALYAGATFTGASAYNAFATSRANRTQVVYVGSNDGMLHGFNAANGNETYAFVPNGAITNDLRSYSNPEYEHRYFVDGEIAVADVYLNGWKTVLVGTLGRGGPGVFALDVTNPNDVKFLWEKSGADIAALGKNIGRPVIAQVANGDWRVLIGNGVGSTGGKAQLVSIALSNGSAKAFDTGVGSNNALSAVLARDSNGDGFADTVYGGDLRGHLWKFTGLTGTGTATSLFVARDANDDTQPITAAPMAGKDPATGKVWVFFGTGQFLDTPDLTTTQVQTWYGLIDSGTVISGRSALVGRDIVAEGAIGGLTVRVIEEGNVAEFAAKRGWYIDLLPPSGTRTGERMVLQNRFQGMALVGATRIPEADDACRPSGKGFVMAIDPFTGGRLPLTFFDVNGDGIFNDADKLNGQIVSGIGLPNSPSNPIFVGDMMHVGLDDGTTTSRKIQGAGVQAERMNWRELLNQ